MTGPRTLCAAAALATSLAVSACGGGPMTEITDALAGSVADRFGGERTSRREPTREELNAQPNAIIAVRREGATRRAYLSAISANGPYVIYHSPAGRSFTLKGGAIAGHRGLSYDLVGFDSSPDDPLVTPTRLDRWPESVTRAYQLRGGDGSTVTRAVVCTPIRGERVEVEIVEIVFDVVEVEDHCRSGELDFTNRYWVAPDTGFIWKSVQWTGPKMFPLLLEIIRPYASQS